MQEVERLIITMRPSSVLNGGHPFHVQREMAMKLFSHEMLNSIPAEKRHRQYLIKQFDEWTN